MAKETIYLCNFRVSVEGDWLCLEELDDVHINTPVICATEDGIERLLRTLFTDKFANMSASVLLCCSLLYQTQQLGFTHGNFILITVIPMFMNVFCVSAL